MGLEGVLQAQVAEMSLSYNDKSEFRQKRCSMLTAALHACCKLCSWMMHAQNYYSTVTESSVFQLSLISSTPMCYAG